ncbi:MAG: hypothetical protein D6746_00245 [Bacteroidetes bacterium]|nr:MAG: hypothetical protein D6746_00245 [Bacteroidota bacterium]GIV58590.1 MAG: hypothetical protein KatS3mg042_1503 [Rhodothermaceae bacterium]
MRKPIRWVLFAFLVLFFGFVLADSLGVFDDRPYFEVPHGNHTHYVPKDCDPPLSPGDAPTRPPGPGERITCQGQIVPE